MRRPASTARRPLPRFHKSYLDFMQARGEGGKWARAANRALRGHVQQLVRDREPPARRITCSKATGHSVVFARGAGRRALCCGRTYLTTGMLDEARFEARRTLDALPRISMRTSPSSGWSLLRVHLSRRVSVAACRRIHA
jgi:hypothetical protein